MVTELVRQSAFTRVSYMCIYAVSRSPHSLTLCRLLVLDQAFSELTLLRKELVEAYGCPRT